MWLCMGKQSESGVERTEWKSSPKAEQSRQSEAPNPTIPKADSVGQLQTLRPRYSPYNHTSQSNKKFPFPPLGLSF